MVLLLFKMSWFLFGFEHISKSCLLFSVESLWWEMFERNNKTIMAESDRLCTKQKFYVCSCLSGNVSWSGVSMSDILDSN